MHPEYRNLDYHTTASTTSAKDFVVNEVSPEWEMPILHLQLHGDDLGRLLDDWTNIVEDVENRILGHTTASDQEKKYYNERSLRSSARDYNLLLYDHPAIELLHRIIGLSQQEFIDEYDVNHSHPVSVHTWATNHLETTEWSQYTSQLQPGSTYLSGAISLSAKGGNETALQSPGFEAADVSMNDKEGNLILFPDWITYQRRVDENVSPPGRKSIEFSLRLNHWRSAQRRHDTNEVRHYVPLTKSPPHEEASRKQLEIESLPYASPVVSDLLTSDEESLDENAPYPLGETEDQVAQDSWSH